MWNKSFFSFFLLSILYTSCCIAQHIYPEKGWQKITNPEQIGWSTSHLNEAKSIADSIGSDAVVIVHRGAILKAWGEIERKFMCHSMRKSLLSAVIGLNVDRGAITIKQTLSEIGIDDSTNRLSELEKTATIEHLLTSRSGIYLPAAYEWPTRKPQREEFKPGEHWFYPNNWDYNALLTIYEQVTKKKLFEDFYASLAVPLNMQDFEISDGYYHYEKHKSSHPAYPFRMSARDLARLGLLFLQHGKWGEKQIISKEWIEKSTSPISQTYAEGEGYGYLWWVDQKNFKYGYYSAEGSGGHGLIIVPDLELVIVHRVNTYLDKRISYRQRGQLISKIMEAFDGGDTQRQLQLENDMAPQPTSNYPFMQDLNKESYTGIYQINKLLDYESETVEVYLNEKNQLEIYIPYKGYFLLHAINKSLFLMADSQEYISFLMNENDLPEKIIYHRNSRVGEKRAKE